MKEYKITILFLIISITINAQGIIEPTQPEAENTYIPSLSYIANGNSKTISLQPIGVEPLIRGGTDGFLAKLTTSFPDWEFEIAETELTGKFIVENYFVCDPTDDACNNVIGTVFDLKYEPGIGDPQPSSSQLHWIQRVQTNHDIDRSGIVGGVYGIHGQPKDKIDIGSDPICQTVPYYDKCGDANETEFHDIPKRPDPGSNHFWLAELYLVEEIGDKKVKIYNGVRWGWKNTDSRIESIVSIEKEINFTNSIPNSEEIRIEGLYTNNILWGEEVSSSTPSELFINPVNNTFRPEIGEPFEFATITYTNGTIRNGSGIDYIDLEMNYRFSIPDLSIENESYTERRGIEIINTLNTCNTTPCSQSQIRESADYLNISPPISLLNLIQYFPDISEMGNNFHVFENESATATLIGVITEADISSPNIGNDITLKTKIVEENSSNLKLNIIGYGRIIEGSGFLSRAPAGISEGDFPSKSSKPYKVKPIKLCSTIKKGYREYDINKLNTLITHTTNNKDNKIYVFIEKKSKKESNEIGVLISNYLKLRGLKEQSFEINHEIPSEIKEDLGLYKKTDCVIIYVN